MDIVLIEKAMTNWVAGVLGLTVDDGIFRGGIPTGFDTGVGVILNGEIRDNTLRPRTYNVQVLGKFGDRDSALRMLSRLAEKLPIYGMTQDDLVFRVLMQRGDSEPYTAEDNGRIKYYASFNMLAVVLTEGTQV